MTSNLTKSRYWQQVHVQGAAGERAEILRTVLMKSASSKPGLRRYTLKTQTRRMALKVSGRISMR